MWADFSDLRRPALRPDELRERLVGPGRPLGRLDVVAEAGSTNAELAAAWRSGATDLPDRTLLVTEHQTAGRGRLGRSWLTPPRSALTMSLLLLPPAQTQPGWPWLSLIMGLVTTQVLRRHAGLEAAIKWPNDVLVPPPANPADGIGEASLKVAGILAEVAQRPDGASAVIIGIGLNVSINTSELAVPSATSLALAGAATTDRSVLLRALVRRWVEVEDRWRASGGDATAAGLADEIREQCATLGRQVRVARPQGDLVGVAEGIDDQGRLLVRSAAGLLPLAAGDVEHVRSVE